MSNPALWARVDAARDYLETMPTLVQSMVEEAYLPDVTGEPDVPISGPRPSSSPPSGGGRKDVAAYRQVCRMLARGDCLLEMAARKSTRIRHDRLPWSAITARQQRVLAPREAARLCQHLRLSLAAAYDVRLERPEAIRLLRESVRTLEGAYNVASGYRRLTPRVQHRRRSA